MLALNTRFEGVTDAFHSVVVSPFPEAEITTFESIRSSVLLTFLAISFGLQASALLELNYRVSTVYFSITLSKTEFCPWPPPSVSITPGYFSQQPQPPFCQ